MQELGNKDVRPNEFTMSVVLSACGQLGALEHGKWAHAYIDKCGLEVGVILGTSSIDMYAKCGSIEKARWMFNVLGPNKDAMAWSAMISGLNMHGHSEECLELFSKMTHHGVRPNAVTFMGVLCACVYGGLVHEGELYFRRMRVEFGITPLIQHYGCMVDLYGRAGLIEAAWNTVNSMPMEPDVIIWGALLSGARMHGDITTCEVALEKLIELEPTHRAAYVLLLNVYTKTESREIHLMLEEIMKRLKAEGYVGNTIEVLLDLDEEGKEMALSLHSEKLAVAFAILKTSADPLFVDQYAGCFVPDNVPMDMGLYPRHYCLATKFVDNKLLTTLNDRDGLRQVVLLTDGMDTRPYRLGWPNSTLIFDVSPERVFRMASKKLEGAYPLPNLLGLPLMTLGSFEVVLSIVSNLAMKGCLFLGELPAWVTEAEAGTKSSTQARMEKIFMGNGFRVKLISYSEVAAKLGRELAPQDCKGLLFVAEQLRFSDDQMENWRREFQRIEEEGDEEGFEEL
ncbi:hypothetical protein RHMOL_Rhmol13G0013600 [Rhododendron molle]|uniref:Uncharacterized protein n=1 Tax=Rhododendron molle TaxID=49168 RepID=A0ACC0L2J7_RHOML|nr:hypothetical protein RHMOL_Rhmol13G0013600 [Rhododendron molle]